MTGAIEGGDSHDPWAEAEAAVHGDKKPVAPPTPPAARPPAQIEQPVDPWAEAEAAILGTASDAPPVDASDVLESPAAESETQPEPPEDDAAAEAEVGPLEEGPEDLDDALLASEAADADDADLADVHGALPETADPEAAKAEADAAPTEDDGLDDATLLRALSALVLAAPEPLSTARLSALVGESSQARVRAALEVLGERLADGGLGIVLAEIAGGWRYATEAALGELVGQLFASRRTERISPAGLETLAIVAYRQPVTKGEIEAIRGVQAGPILRTLVDRGLVRVAGRADQPGAPLLYGTTREFLDRFGLARLEDLPRDGELARD